MIKRRDFLKIAGAAGGLGALKPIQVLGSRYQTSSDYFTVHPFIENHPEAVFIMRTDVDSIDSNDQIKSTAYEFSHSVFIPSDEAGIPLTHNIAIKPNLTSRCCVDDRPCEHIGIVTNVYFTEGVIEGIKNLGISGSQIYMCEVNAWGQQEAIGYAEMAERTGTNRRTATSSESEYVTWVEYPEGVAMRRIPYIWPINSPNSWLLNLATFKTHGMGLTLTLKNHQGSVAGGYQGFCSAMSGLLGLPTANRNPNANADITALFNSHKDTIPRWDKPGSSYNSGIGMEVWVHRTLDNHSATPTGLCVIDGIIGRECNGFQYGPHPDPNDYNGYGINYLSNIIIFGKDPFRTDIIGKWIGGHEPGNFGLFHIAIERGLSDVLNPRSIPVYEWNPVTNEATLTPLDDFERTPLLTFYLQRDYDGQTENVYHLCDEEFDYSSVGIETEYMPELPGAYILQQNRPNPFNPNTTIEYHLPEAGNVSIGIFNSRGQRVDVLVDGYRKRGYHMAVWNAGNHSSGTYYYRFITRNFKETKKMILLK